MGFSKQKVDIQPLPKTRAQPQSAHYAQERCACILNSPKISSAMTMHLLLLPLNELCISKWILGMFHPLPLGHPLLLKYPRVPVLGKKGNKEMSTLSQRYSAEGAWEKQPTWWHDLILRHHQTLRVQGLGKQPGLQGGLEGRR